MPLIHASIAPHAGDLIPETVPDPAIVKQTRDAMVAMGEHLQALRPDVVIIANPHGFRVQNAMSVSLAERAVADWSPGVRLEFDMDPSLAGAIASKAEEMDIPVVRYLYGASGGPDCFIPLDWGAAVPLYFMGHRYRPKPRLVHLSPMRLLPLATHYDFGRAIGKVIKESKQRIAFIASADQGHAHDPEGPYGFDPAAAEYDAWMQAVIRSGDLEALLSVDPDVVENGKPDSLWPTLILAGVLKENPMAGRLLSYEVNVYFGILCAEFRAE
jgi:aromatic ring-opening dioxygenase LigB subunit